ncbi:class I SAM-dependent methyltransferase [Nonomuraea sp. B12E4]|uniref:class I SAM-dependent methyltransferase n=1 Tax=Nonomuraea sp. B12E4 TaxID=3153564 RepID=UPI00325F7B80
MTTTSTAYGAELSEIYDFIYRERGKDFAGEAESVARVVRARLPRAASLLDVACGTGEHLVRLRELIGDVEGLELSPEMCAAARAKLPGVPVHVGDMRGFDLGRRFDAVCCLFSSVAYMPTVVELAEALRSMARHLLSGGVLVIDPLWFPDRFIDGYVAGDVVRGDGRTVARVSHTSRDGTTVRQEAHFVVADETGIRHFTEVQRLTLHSREDYLTAFEQAGCPAEYLEGELSARGLFVGVRG